MAKKVAKKLIGRPKRAVIRDKRISIRCSAEELDAANRYAESQGKSLANMIRAAVGLPEESYGTDFGK